MWAGQDLCLLHRFESEYKDTVMEAAEETNIERSTSEIEGGSMMIEPIRPGLGGWCAERDAGASAKGLPVAAKTTIEKEGN
jgi:hypothetical protein